MRSRLSFIGYFAWIVVALALWGGYRLSGLPHVIWTYEFTTTSQSRMDFEGRWYTRCTFIGPYGAFTRPAEQGRCGWVAFFHAGEVLQ